MTDRSAAEDAVRFLDEASEAARRVEMTPIGPLPVWLSMAEVSNLTGRSVPAIKRAIAQGDFPAAYDVLGKPCIRASDYANWTTTVRRWKVA